MALRNWSFTRVVVVNLTLWVLGFVYLNLMADVQVRETGIAWLPFFVPVLLPCIIVPVWASQASRLAEWHPGRFLTLWGIAALMYLPLSRWRIGGLVAFVAPTCLLSLTWFGIEHRLRRR
jgi:hypothetical protein